LQLKFVSPGLVDRDCRRQNLACEADRFATTSFSLGLIFSVLLTLTLGIFLGIAGIFALLGHLFGIALKPR
jgi:hypothetical protein